MKSKSSRIYEKGQRMIIQLGQINISRLFSFTVLDSNELVYNRHFCVKIYTRKFETSKTVFDSDTIVFNTLFHLKVYI